ncbi:MAG: aldehyde dehydrogenase family protein, partial [Sphingomonadales bacterium]|nr:aldehyde dehydrogenase family protein [Sphingomonadales bacterium]
MHEYRMLIDGRMVDGEATMDVINPATGKPFATAPRASLAQLEEAVTAARAAFPGWAATPWDERRAALIAIAEALEANAGEIAPVLTMEQGKPVRAAMEEIYGTAMWFRATAALDLPERVLADDDARRVIEQRRPLGVVAAIVPWNFPLMMIGFKLPPALLAGNTVVLKPAPTTPLATLMLAQLIAGIVPAG